MADDFQPSEMLCSKDYKKKKTVALDHLNLLNMFLEMRVPSAAGILKVRSDKRKVCLFLYLLWT
jgi:hypothetical protein